MSSFPCGIPGSLAIDLAIDRAYLTDASAFRGKLWLRLFSVIDFTALDTMPFIIPVEYKITATFLATFEFVLHLRHIRYSITLLRLDHCFCNSPLHAGSEYLGPNLSWIKYLCLDFLGIKYFGFNLLWVKYFGGNPLFLGHFLPLGLNI